MSIGLNIETANLPVRRAEQRSKSSPVLSEYIYRAVQICHLHNSITFTHSPITSSTTQLYRYLYDTIILMKLALATIAFLFMGLSAGQEKARLVGQCNQSDNTCYPFAKACEQVSIL